MTCIHGLDESNCPTCRIIKSALPEEQKKLDSRNINYLKPEHPVLRQSYKKKDEFEKDLMLTREPMSPKFINPIMKPNMLNELPSFENRMFQERMSEIDLDKSDIFGISKRIPLESPEWKFKEQKE